jgi:predicted nucleic acid-binding protein
MMHKSKAFILDSWSIIAYLEDEPAGENVGDIIAKAHEEGSRLLMSVVNAGELWYIIARETSENEAEQAIHEIRELGIEFIDADWKLAHCAAQFKAKKKMSFADGFAAALAKQEKDAVLLTGDKEFRQVEGEIKIHWLSN